LQSKYLGQENNSIGIWHKNGMLIDGSWTKIGNDNEYFKKGDFVGIGLILQPNSKMEILSRAKNGIWEDLNFKKLKSTME
jgi:hypothetical protein